MTTYNPAEVERMIAEVREFGDFTCGPGCSGQREECPTRIAGDWAVENLRAMADQLEAAQAEIVRLRDDLGHATAHEGDWLSKTSRAMCETVLGERDALRAKLRERDAALARLRSELDTANTARSLAEARANNLNASHAARDEVKRRIAARLGLPAHATQEEIAEAVDTLEGVRQREADAAVAWETKCDDARAKVATMEERLASTRPVLDAVIAWHLRSPLAFSHIVPDDLNAAMERLMDKARGVDSSTSATIGHHPRPTHLVVIAREQRVTVTPFYDAPSAIAFADDAGAQWSETYVAAIIKGPLV